MPFWQELSAPSGFRCHYGANGRAFLMNCLVTALHVSCCLGCSNGTYIGKVGQRKVPVGSAASSALLGSKGAGHLVPRRFAAFTAAGAASSAVPPGSRDQWSRSLEHCGGGAAALPPKSPRHQPGCQHQERASCQFAGKLPCLAARWRESDRSGAALRRRGLAVA